MNQNQNQNSPLSREVLEKIISLCDDVAWGRSVNEDVLFSYTVEGSTHADLVRLAEAFGFMLVKLGARDEYSKRLIEELQIKNSELEIMKNTVEKRNSRLLELVQKHNTAKRLVGQCPLMQQAIKLALSIAKHPCNTLLLGETGTGKEEFAKLIHFSSARSAKPFIAVNCSAIPDSLFESEMFGIEKGVATGVVQKKGLMEEAHEGTLFLDEIADMPLTHQAKLLRVLEDRKLTRIGSVKPINIDIKVIAAANINLEKAVQEGHFRMDLYYRLNVAEIQIPALKDRGEDILLLAQKFLDTHCIQMKKEYLSLGAEAKQALLEYAWPGNVRELNNEMERAVVLSIGNSIELADLSQKIQLSLKEKRSMHRQDFVQKESEVHNLDSSHLQAEKDNALPFSFTGNLLQTVASTQASAMPRLMPPQGIEHQHAMHFAGFLQNKKNNAQENTIPETFNLFEMEKHIIMQALEKTAGNRSKAAILLGITREGLRKKLLRIGMN